MLERMRGDILDSTADYTMIPLNCQGVQGAGLALQWKKSFPVHHRAYMEEFKVLSPPQPGDLRTGPFINGRAFMYAYTKDHWRDPSRMAWIERIIAQIPAFYGLVIAMPAIGAGLGGLKPEKVVRKIEKMAEAADVEVELWTH